ncbi:hypothetical protein [Rhodococcus sp. NPDC047139]|uniref:hypothetical protein n=1 Tax=Rhodococcus sp. NPDC047139 TaxID=3155141 RepID=UPI0033D59225
MPNSVRLEPHVIEEILRVCEIMLAEFENSSRTASRLQATHGFGDFESAQQLAAGYRRKASGTPESAVERIEQFSKALKQLRDAFATGGEAFLDTEFDWARQLDTLDSEQPYGNQSSAHATAGADD